MRKFLVATETATVIYNDPRRVEVNHKCIIIDHDTYSYNQIKILKIDKLTFNFFSGSYFTDENGSSEPERYIASASNTREFDIQEYIQQQLCKTDF